MRKAVKHIPTSFASLSDWDSHKPALNLAVTKGAIGSITEFGCGEGSTPMLKALADSVGCNFFSYETNAEYAERYNATKMNDYNEIHLSDREWKQSILFIDLAPGEQRKEMIAKHANNAFVIVVHDTEPGAEYVYGMSEVLNSFKYRLDYEPVGKPHTAIVSNFINVTEWV